MFGRIGRYSEGRFYVSIVFSASFLRRLAGSGFSVLVTSLGALRAVCALCFASRVVLGYACALGSRSVVQVCTAFYGFVAYFGSLSIYSLSAKSM